MSLLKLHGSVNWGLADFSPPQAEDADVFYVDPELGKSGSNITQHGVFLPMSTRLFPGVGFRPLIVPPVTDKSRHYGKSMLRRLWHFAREVLSASDRVVILGYSFPPTDYEARFLLREAFGSHTGRLREREVVVVNPDGGADYRKRTAASLLNCDATFVNDDAMAFIRGHLGGGTHSRTVSGGHTSCCLASRDVLDRRRRRACSRRVRGRVDE